MTGSSKSNARDLGTKRSESGRTDNTERGGQPHRTWSSVVWKCFWWTIVTLVSVTLVLSIMATVNQPRSDTGVSSSESPEAIQLPPGCLPVEDLRRRVEGRTVSLLEYLLRRPFRETGEAIRDRIDLAFEPMYERIPILLDRHYTVSGQYLELGLAAVGQLQQEMESRLFQGMDERLDAASAAIDGVLEAELRDSIEQWLGNEGQTVGPDCDAGLVYEDLLDEVIQDSLQRFRTLVVPTGVTALGGAAAGKAAVTAVIKSMSKKMAASTAVKVFGKMVPKMLGKWGGAAAGGAAGAALGAVLGPAGAVVGGVVGVGAGVAGWLTVDWVVVTVDEYRNRDELESELTAMLDRQKAEMVESISNAFENRRSEALDGLTPSELTNPN